MAHRRQQAYAVLGDPVSRAVYDQELGYSKADLARLIGSRAGWGTTWAILFGLLALFFLLDHENLSRMVGSNFTPDYYEVREYVDEEICRERGCREECTPGYYVGRFHSSNPQWEWVLNSWLALPLAPALITGLTAWSGHQFINGAISRIIVSLRYLGHADSWVRSVAFMVVLLLPIAVNIFVASYGLGMITPYE